MAKSDTHLEVEHDYVRDRMNIIISMPAARWRLASWHNSRPFELFSYLASQGRLADLFTMLADIFANDEGEAQQTQEVKVEIIDRPLLPGCEGSGHD